jgi:transposase-like protein
MPRRCTVCDHHERHSIDEALVSGAPYRSVAKRFGLSESAVYRHKTEHLPAHLLKAREVEEVAKADDLLDQVRNLRTHALDILERAEKAGDLRTALAAIIALHRALYHPESLILCLASALRQSQELFTKIATFFTELDRPVAPLAGEGVIPIG